MSINQISLLGNEYDKKLFKPVKIWGLVRHGTRYPKKETIYQYKNMTQLKETILERKNRLPFNKVQIEHFEEWMPFMLDPLYQKYLANEGYLEMIQFGMRMKTRFPEVQNWTKSFQVNLPNYLLF